jgi:hypothetical protein
MLYLWAVQGWTGVVVLGAARPRIDLSLGCSYHLCGTPSFPFPDLLLFCVSYLACLKGMLPV